MPGLDYLGNNAAITMVAFQDMLHAFFRVSTDLEWAQLQIDDDTGNTNGWA